MRVACALVPGYGIIWLLETTWAATGWPDRHAGAFFFALAGFAPILLGTVAVSCWLGLYRPAPVQPGAGA